jgi:hypothetical protein
MTRLLQPPEEGWRGRFSFIKFSFIKQILRSAFRVPDRTDPISVSLSTISTAARVTAAPRPPKPAMLRIARAAKTRRANGAGAIKTMIRS